MEVFDTIVCVYSGMDREEKGRAEKRREEGKIVPEWRNDRGDEMGWDEKGNRWK